MKVAGNLLKIMHFLSVTQSAISGSNKSKTVFNQAQNAKAGKTITFFKMYFY